MTEKQIHKKIYEKYPATKKEIQGCIQEILLMKKHRDAYRKQLIAEQKEKKEY